MKKYYYSTTKKSSENPYDINFIVPSGSEIFKGIYRDVPPFIKKQNKNPKLNKKNIKKQNKNPENIESILED